jgi:hypothetical protein
MGPLSPIRGFDSRFEYLAIDSRAKLYRVFSSAESPKSLPKKTANRILNVINRMKRECFEIKFFITILSF